MISFFCFRYAPQNPKRSVGKSYTGWPAISRRLGNSWLGMVLHAVARIDFVGLSVLVSDWLRGRGCGWTCAFYWLNATLS